MFRRLAERVRKTRPQFRESPGSVKKLSASLLERHPVYGRLKDHFLGHSARTMADRHYAVRDQNLFDEAVTWLGKQLGQA
jgi:hypothetical protein